MKTFPISKRLPFTALKINTPPPPRFYCHEPGWVWNPPPFEDFDLLFVLDGYGQLQLNASSYPLVPHACMIIAPGDIVQARYEPGKRIRMFAIHFDFVDARGRIRRSREAALPLSGIIIHEATWFLTLARQCERSFRQSSALGLQQSRLLLGQMLLHLGSELQTSASPPVDLLMISVQDWILEEPGRFWSVAELARKSGLSPSRFARRFTDAFNISPNRFLIQTRIEQATHLLRETDMSVSQIADILGYRDVFYFSRQYKHETGHSPGGIRRCQD